MSGAGRRRETVNLRWIILHKIEETARHAGHTFGWVVRA